MIPIVKQAINRFGKKLLIFLNKVFPKKEQVVICGLPNVESSAVEVANYIKDRYKDYPVFFTISKKYKDNPIDVLRPGVNLLPTTGSLLKQVFYFYKLFTSKYIFMTHGLPIEKFSKKQIVVNIWHGVLYKKVGVLLGGRSIQTDVTVGTSHLTQKMFAKAFGVSEESVYISGYPRNDAMLIAQKQKSNIKEKLGTEFQQYKNIIIWLPTFRQRDSRDKRLDGVEVGNPFYIEDFDIVQFNNILKENNSFCLVKPHPMAVTYDNNEQFSNLSFIDDQWVSNRGMSLYQLVGVTDLLISDISSIVIDYLLLDNPIICMSADFETYRKSRGFYFKNIENWLPNLFKDQESFFDYLTDLLSNKIDPFMEKRFELKNKFFKYQDSNSTKRLVDFVLDKEKA